MNSTQIKKSQLHRAIAKVAYFIENHAPDGSYTFQEADTTLEISSTALETLRQFSYWQSYEADYLAAGCHVRCNESIQNFINHG